MQPELIYVAYYVAILILLIVLKVFFIILNRMAKGSLSLPANFFVLTFVFSYLGLSAGFVIGYIEQAAITIAVLAMLSFACGTISVIFNDRYNTGFNRKIGAYSIVLITMALAIGSGIEDSKMKRQEDIDAKNIFQRNMKMEKNKAVVKKSEQAIVFTPSR
ncbi:MAG: hypothetical protein ABI581_00955 [Sediminibacterium sp.]